MSDDNKSLVFFPSSLSLLFLPFHPFLLPLGSHRIYLSFVIARLALVLLWSYLNNALIRQKLLWRIEGPCNAC